MATLWDDLNDPIIGDLVATDTAPVVADPHAAYYASEHDGGGWGGYDDDPSMHDAPRPLVALPHDPAYAAIGECTCTFCTGLVAGNLSEFIAQVDPVNTGEYPDWTL